MDKYSIGMIGLGTMGSNFMLNIADHHHSIIGYDKDPARVNALKALTEYKNIDATIEIVEFVAGLQKPARIILLVPAGPIVDFVIKDLLPLLEEGDIIIDGGNSYYKDTDRRFNELITHGIHFMGMGISGGEEGARIGPSIMPSGDRAAYEKMQIILNDVAAKYNDLPCARYMGNASAGHYIKMVHNGIEYGMMQLIAETYDILKNGLGLDNDDIADLFTKWNKGKLSSFLVESAALVLIQRDTNASGYLIDFIKDIARSKGTGKWTSQEAMDLQVPVPTIDMAVVARDLSAYANSRDVISGYIPARDNSIDVNITIDDVESALFTCFALTYIQGLHLIRVASRAYNYNTEMKDVINNWRAGCIIRSGLLENFEKVYSAEGFDGLILADKDIHKLIAKHMPKLKKVVLFALQNDFGASALTATKTYYNMLKENKSPMNMIQGLRDLFGAHTFERTDQEGVFHHIWK